MRSRSAGVSNSTSNDCHGPSSRTLDTSSSNSFHKRDSRSAGTSNDTNNSHTRTTLDH
jgi:hypothetical protein